MDHNFPNIPGLQSAINWMQDNLSERRMEHIFRVAHYAKILANKFLLTSKESESAIVAALLHDITKEKPPAFQIQLLKKYHPQKEYLPFPVQHAWTGPDFVIENLFKLDPLVIKAMRYHTTGQLGMGKVEKVVFIADYFGSVPTEEFNLIEDQSLNQLCLKKITNSIHFLLKKQMIIVPDTIDFYNELVREQ